MARILVVDDEPAVRKVIASQLGSEHEIGVACDGQECLKRLETDSYDLLITDLKMPVMDGVKLHHQVRARFPDLAVIVLTGYPSVRTSVELLRYGAYNYLTKPVTRKELLTAVREAIKQQQLKLEEKQLAHKLRADMESLSHTLSQLTEEQIIVLVATMEAKDIYLKGHSEQVRELSLAVGKKIALPPSELHSLAQAAILHDIGKIGVPEQILNKPGLLTEEEFRRVAAHSAIGARILESVESFRPLAPIVRWHHEWFDGKGYPDGLEGEEIPMCSRIIGLTDAFSAMTSERPYRSSLTKDTALAKIKQNSATQFDPKLVSAFFRLMTEELEPVK